MTSLIEILRPARPTLIVDVGANPIDGAPPYQPMLDEGLCRVIGFEPQPEALAALKQSQSPLEAYLPHVIGDGGKHTLHVCVGSGMTSLLEPDPRMLAVFEALRPLAEVKERLPVVTRRLDDIAEIPELDFLKLDVQGSEWMVLVSGRQKLARAVVIQIEVSFVTLYRNQPSFGVLDVELRKQGFLPHTMAALKRWPIAPTVIDGDPKKPLGQLLEADLVYVRDFTQPEAMDPEQLKHLALIVHHCYGSADLTLRCILLLEARGALAEGAHKQYLALLQGAP